MHKVKGAFGGLETCYIGIFLVGKELETISITQMGSADYSLTPRVWVTSRHLLPSASHAYCVMHTVLEIPSLRNTQVQTIAQKYGYGTLFLCICKENIKNWFLHHDAKLSKCIFFSRASEHDDRSVSTRAGRPALLSSFNSGETVLFSLHIKRSLNEMKSSSFNKQHKYLILF